MRIPFLGRNEPVRLRVAKTADAPELARLHAEGFAYPWSTGTLESMLAERNVCGQLAETRTVLGFALFRSAADEAELLSIAVAKAGRGKGLGRRLIEAGLDELMRRRVRQVFLEVEAENAAALRLYAGAGFVKIGLRPGYYRQPDGSRRDALMFRLELEGRPPPPVLLDG